MPIAGAWAPYYAELTEDSICWNDQMDPNNPPDILTNGALDFYKAYIAHPEMKPKEVDPKGMLDAFIRIKSGPEVRNFVMRYGPLELCSDGLPATRWHRPGLGLTCMPPSWEGCDTWCEKLAHWLDYVRIANSIVDITSALNQDQKAPADCWAGTQVFLSIDTQTTARQGIAQQKIWLAFLIEGWLQLGDASLTFSWSRSEPEFSLHGNTFATLGLQMMFAVSQKQRLVFCSACGEPYTRKRKPQRHRNNYCSQACKKSGAVLRKRAERQKKRGESGDGQERE